MCDIISYEHSHNACLGWFGVSAASLLWACLRSLWAILAIQNDSLFVDASCVQDQPYGGNTTVLARSLSVPGTECHRERSLIGYIMLYSFCPVRPTTAVMMFPSTVRACPRCLDWDGFRLLQSCNTEIEAYWPTARVSHGPAWPNELI